jgi:hypothetical protein
MVAITIAMIGRDGAMMPPIPAPTDPAITPAINDDEPAATSSCRRTSLGSDVARAVYSIRDNEINSPKTM